MPKPFISVNDLCMDFDDTRVLNRVSFEIPEGEIVGVIGRSGAGKSVLMHLLRGVERPPTSGSIIYHMAACNRCTFMDVQSRAVTTCPEVRGQTRGCRCSISGRPTLACEYLARDHALVSEQGNAAAVVGGGGAVARPAPEGGGGARMAAAAELRAASWCSGTARNTTGWKGEAHGCTWWP